MKDVTNTTVKWVAHLILFKNFSVQVPSQRQATLEAFLWDSYSTQTSGQQAHARSLLLPAKYLPILYSIIVLSLNFGLSLDSTNE
jgi:hypothetical protein